MNGEFANKVAKNPTKELLVINGSKYLLHIDYLYVENIDVTKTLIKIIEKYIPVQMDGNIPETLVLLHNRAVNGSNLDQMIPDELVNQTSSCTLSDLSATMTYNYTVCNQCYDRLNKLQIIIKKYIDKQKELK